MNCDKCDCDPCLCHVPPIKRPCKICGGVSTCHVDSLSGCCVPVREQSGWRAALRWLSGLAAGIP